MCDIGKVAVEEGVDYLPISCLNEGATLRASGIPIPILVLGAIYENQIQYLIDRDQEFTISSRYKENLVLDV